MKEVIAEKVGGVIWVYLALTLVCGGLLVYFFGFYSGNGYLQFLISVILIVCIVVCFSAFIMAVRTPGIIATYDENGILKFREFSCRPRELERVEYKFARGGRYRPAPDHGTLYVYYKGKKYSYYFVRNLQKASDRLAELLTADKELEKFEQEEQSNG